jgi:hypothetical protein
VSVHAASTPMPLSRHEKAPIVYIRGWQGSLEGTPAVIENVQLQYIGAFVCLNLPTL